MDETLSKLQFQLLKPSCVSLMRNRNEAALKDLQCQIQALPSLSPSLLEYVLFPLKMVLQQCAVRYDALSLVILIVCINAVRGSSSLLESTLICLDAVLSKTSVTSFETLQELLTMLCLLIDDNVQKGAGLENSEFTINTSCLCRSLSYSVWAWPQIRRDNNMCS